MVDVQDLSHKFDTRYVLKNIDLHVDEGKICVIMGSSGGGKTTLLKCIAALLNPTEGTVTVDGTDVVKNPTEARLKMGLVFQYAALLDSLNVEDNILFGLRRKPGHAKQRERELLEELLKELNLEGTEKQMPAELSGGMRKRVGLARALCMEPKVLLYDEPTSGLDPVTAYSIDRMIVDTRDRLNVTSVVVSHDVSSVMRVADQIIFLHKGEVLYNGIPDGFWGSTAEEIQELVTKARVGTFEATE